MGGGANNAMAYISQSRISNNRTPGRPRPSPLIVRWHFLQNCANSTSINQRFLAGPFVDFFLVHSPNQLRLRRRRQILGNAHKVVERGIVDRARTSSRLKKGSVLFCSAAGSDDANRQRRICQFNGPNGKDVVAAVALRHDSVQRCRVQKCSRAIILAEQNVFLGERNERSSYKCKVETRVGVHRQKSSAGLTNSYTWQPHPVPVVHSTYIVRPFLKK